MMASSRQSSWEELALPKPEPAGIPAPELTHPLRAPVTALRLGIEILREQIQEKLSADQKKLLDGAVEHIISLEGLVNDIMDYSKIVAGKMRLKPQACDARQIIGETLESLQAVAIAKGVKLIKEEEGEPLPPAWAEPKRIAQILTNLVSNAVKFTPSRGMVRVGVKKGKNEYDGTLVFTVTDTGCGIPTEDLEKIFSLFMQSSPNLQKTQGTGLGLTLARLMVELHGGKIWAESWKGLGATFHFTLPIKPAKNSWFNGSLSRRASACLAIFL